MQTQNVEEKLILNVTITINNTKSAIDHYEHYENGTTYVQHGEIERQVVEITNNNQNPAEAHFDLGIKYDQQGKYDLAEREYKAALDINPGHVHARTNLAGVYTKQEKFGLAEQEYEAAVKADPKHAIALHNFGVMYGLQKKFDLAAQKYEAAIAVNPDFKEAREGLEHIRKIAEGIPSTCEFAHQMQEHLKSMAVRFEADDHGIELIQKLKEQLASVAQDCNKANLNNIATINEHLRAAIQMEEQISDLFWSQYSPLKVMYKEMYKEMYNQGVNLVNSIFAIFGSNQHPTEPATDAEKDSSDSSKTNTAQSDAHGGKLAGVINDHQQEL